MLSLLDSRSLPLLDAEVIPEALLGLAVSPTSDPRRHGSLDVTIMQFRRWARDDRAALFLWEECWIGAPDALERHLDHVGSDSDRALVVGHGLFDYAYPALDRLGMTAGRLVARTVDVGLELAVKVERENPYVTYHSGLTETARANSEGRIGPDPTRAFDERFAGVGDDWRRSMWEATVSCWLWTRMVAGGEIGLPPNGHKRVHFGEDDLAVLLGIEPRFDPTIWELQRMLDDEQHAA